MFRFEITILAFLFSAPTLGDVYHYTDKNGVVHLTNIRPRKDKRYKLKFRTSSGTSHRGGGRKQLRTSSQYDGWIEDASEYYKVPVTLIRSIIQVESAYNPRAISRVGAMGLMQLMPATAKAMKVYDAFDPKDNIFGGVRLLRRLADRFNGDLVLTIAGYHAGPQAVMRYQGLPPYDTTRKYVRMVLKVYYRLKKLVEEQRVAKKSNPGKGEQ